MIGQGAQDLDSPLDSTFFYLICDVFLGSFPEALYERFELLSSSLTVIKSIVAKDIDVVDDSLVLEHAIVLGRETPEIVEEETTSMSESSPLLLMVRKFSRLLFLLAQLIPYGSLGATMLLLSVRMRNELMISLLSLGNLLLHPS
ncbi:hypothetical protein I3843_11G063000 [Carya illinoinensis]|nr:hypothetical protein I3843_11G063000 [Carya illinoinensis]